MEYSYKGGSRLMFSTIKFTANDKKISFDFKNKSNIIVSGVNKLNLIYALEMLLSSTFNKDIATKDIVYGIKYADITECALTFDNGAIIFGKNGRIAKQGNVPNIHCIRHTYNGIIRSYLFSDYSCNAGISNSLTSYSPILSDNDWFRLCAITNRYLGVDVVSLENNKLTFNFSSDIKYSIDAQKFVYLLFAECMLTPEGFKRVVLLGDINILDKSSQVRLIKYLNLIRNQSCSISTINVSFDDEEIKNNNITVLSI